MSLFNCGEEDEKDNLDWPPVAPEVDDPEEPGWRQLEVSTEQLNSLQSF